MKALHLGITGRMGSGKSFICRIFEEEFGIAVFYSDREAKKCYENPEIKSEIRQLFGNTVLFPDGSYDWKKIGDAAFGNQQLLQQLNEIIHPCVMKEYQRWKNEQCSPYTLFESAIIYEQHLEQLFDGVIYIQCPTDIIMERVRLRNGWNMETISRRLQQQQLQEDYSNKADYLILHDSRNSLEESRKKLLPQLERIHSQLLKSRIHV